MCSIILLWQVHDHPGAEALQFALYWKYLSTKERYVQVRVDAVDQLKHLLQYENQECLFKE